MYDEHYILHGDMCRKFQEWFDSLFEKEHGYSYWELCRQEQLVARLYVASNLSDPHPDAKEEFDRVVSRYREVWLPRRQALGSNA